MFQCFMSLQFTQRTLQNYKKNLFVMFGLLYWFLLVAYLASVLFYLPLDGWLLQWVPLQVHHALEEHKPSLTPYSQFEIPFQYVFWKS